VISKSRAERGQILPIFCLMLALLLLPVTGLAVDGGTLLSAHAHLAGAAQAAAEAAAQAVDVTALQRHDAFELCTVPDGGADCGNGVGTVGEVVTDVVSASYQGAPSWCANDGVGPLHSPPSRGSGCAFTVDSTCSSVDVAALGEGARADGVTVRTWQTIQLPLLVFPGWSSVRLTSSATAWMQHGFATQNSARQGGADSC
jgi:hypothetical protein